MFDCNCGSAWCVLDCIAHRLKVRWRWLCDRHDAVITGGGS